MTLFGGTEYPQRQCRRKGRPPKGRLVKKTSKQEGKGRSRPRPAAQTKLANRSGIAEGKRREQRLAGIVASVIDAIIAIDERNEIRLVNPAVEQIFGYSEARLLGKPIGAAIYPADAEDIDALVKAADGAMYNAKQVRNSFRFCKT